MHLSSAVKKYLDIGEKFNNQCCLLFTLAKNYLEINPCSKHVSWWVYFSKGGFCFFVFVFVFPPFGELVCMVLRWLKVYRIFNFHIKVCFFISFLLWVNQKAPIFQAELQGKGSNGWPKQCITNIKYGSHWDPQAASAFRHCSKITESISLEREKVWLRGLRFPICDWVGAADQDACMVKPSWRGS